MLYDYICDTCGFEKEVQHSMNDTPKVICDSCGDKLDRSGMRKKIGSGSYTCKFFEGSTARIDVSKAPGKRMNKWDS